MIFASYFLIRQTRQQLSERGRATKPSMLRTALLAVFFAAAAAPVVHAATSPGPTLAPAPGSAAPTAKPVPPSLKPVLAPTAAPTAGPQPVLAPTLAPTNPYALVEQVIGCCWREKG